MASPRVAVGQCRRVKKLASSEKSAGREKRIVWKHYFEYLRPPTSRKTVTPVSVKCRSVRCLRVSYARYVFSTPRVQSQVIDVSINLNRDKTDQ